MVLVNDFAYNGSVSRVSRIEFAIMSPDDIREQSVVQVEKALIAAFREADLIAQVARED